MKKIYVFVVFLLAMYSGFCQENWNIFDVARKGNLAQIEDIFKNNPQTIFLVDENGFSPLILACYHNNYAAAKFLVEHKSNVNFASPMGTALMSAVVKGNVEITKLLLENNAEVNSSDPKGTTALMYAAMFNNSELIKLLLSHHADKTKVDNKGKTVFEYAVFSGNEEIINLLK
jgi:ankyrin repeat protein